jgi:hypothetical protein
MNIAGNNDDVKWKAIQVRLEANPSLELWEEAYTEFHYKRIELRYLNPIRLLGETRSNEGEGFSMVALFCTLIEFLATSERGMNFNVNIQTGRRPNVLGHEYGLGTGSDYFRDLLTTNSLFHGIVPLGTAANFYSHVRCGLLHEARTGDGWTIVADSTTSIGPKPVYRDRILPALIDYLKDYHSRLVLFPESLPHTPLQAAFIRKWEHLAKP